MRHVSSSARWLNRMVSVWRTFPRGCDPTAGLHTWAPVKMLLSKTGLERFGLKRHLGLLFVVFFNVLPISSIPV